MIVALERAPAAEQWCDLTGNIVVDAVQPHKRRRCSAGSSHVAVSVDASPATVNRAVKAAIARYHESTRMPAERAKLLAAHVSGPLLRRTCKVDGWFAATQVQEVHRPEHRPEHRPSPHRKRRPLSETGRDCIILHLNLSVGQTQQCSNAFRVRPALRPGKTCPCASGASPSYLTKCAIVDRQERRTGKHVTKHFDFGDDHRAIAGQVVRLRAAIGPQRER